MSPYRPVHLNSRVRILVAAILAIAFHAALINLEFAEKPLWIPNVSFPRTVNVFLGRNKIVEKMPGPTQEESVDEDMKRETLPTESNPESPVESVRNILTPENKKVEMQPSAVIKEERAPKPADVATEINEPAVEEITQPPPESKSFGAESIPEADKAADDKLQERSAHEGPSQTPGDDAGQQKVGIIRMAYPDYRVNAPPPYPFLARKRAQEGTVILQVLVNQDGRVGDLDIETSSGFSLLDRAALAAVKKWRFEPGREGGKIIPMWVRVPVTFKLKK